MLYVNASRGAGELQGMETEGSLGSDGLQTNSRTGFHLSVIVEPTGITENEAWMCCHNYQCRHDEVLSTMVGK